MNRIRPLLLCALLFLGCQRVPDKIEPTISYAVQDKYLLSLPSPFPPLDVEERSNDWGKEMLIGFGFAHQLDLYQAITAFKRAEILIPSNRYERRLEIDYEIILCYYIGKKYNDVIYTFERSDLRFVDDRFPALHDLLMVLYDTYLEEKMDSQAEKILELIRHYYPDAAEQLTLSRAFIQADLGALHTIASTPPPRPYLNKFLEDYNQQKKSVGQAQFLNALLPGAGYLYLGQNQSAATAFFLNGLFIAASVYFFEQGNAAAGIIFTSFEAGWYFGGIYGAGLETKAYNERLYEKLSNPVMNRERLFPVLMLNYAF